MFGRRRHTLIPNQLPAPSSDQMMRVARFGDGSLLWVEVEGDVEAVGIEWNAAAEG